ncbi:UbiD family decarboxylase [Amycolatopsis acidiphila]|uniref:Phenolic acid decarboxylase n=1 Tax=Amycolatopsis acidiphila TaxID=715473 RepID=A0A558AKL4_9PSEU|nr:non-oxidative hydroxyarylic acid decarboxylases subunit C [Amycolatopsis acidiphila]TVT24804.1 UbiD family decarboxylase [Amycolatopsis acidiphila]UIJ62784.1 UbiD family decarboxylase [Amycolatopsis acidiphila]GHG64160.1 phenolic acid decarboxylase subunit C [Amycolatopsis acidiphila]
MPYRDLREFLSVLEEEGQLLKHTDPVHPEPDLSAAARAVPNLTDRGPALLFDNIHGYRRGRVALNVVGSWPNHALMLGMDKDTPVKEQFFEFARRWDDYPVPAERRDDAPWQEHTIDEGIDLFQLLPLFRLNRYDVGTYIDKAVVVSRDPDDPDHFGKQNAGIYRIQVKDKATLGIQPLPTHDIGLHLRAAEERGENLPVAIAIGNDPVMTTVSGMPLTYEQSEYEMAGAIQGEPYRIAKAPLTGLDVPWGAEVVLEGEILAGVREIEGPFGEFTGHYSGGRRQPVIRITKVSHRTDPIFEHLYLGMPWTEMDYTLALNTSVPLYQQLKKDFPEVVAVNAMYTQGLLAVVSVKQRYGGFAKAVGMRAMTTPHGLGYCKVMIMVDETVDPFNLAQVMWAMSVKFHPQHDIVTVPNASVLPLDPSSDPAGITHKVVFDATTPIAPETRGHYSQTVDAPADTKKWEDLLKGLIK